MKLPPGHVAGQGVAKPKCTGGFGERMLRTMGWQTGEGLGKEGTGIKEAIQVKKKEDTVGVGGNGSYAWGDKWWEKAFDSAVATVDDSGSSDSSDSDSDDEHMAAIAAAVNRDGTRTSASADELKLLASLSKKGGRVAAGRFGGRDAKMARIRAQEAAMAAAAAEKLGVPSGPSGTTAGAAGGASDRSDTTSEVKLSGGSKKRGSSKKGEAASGADASSGGQQQQQPAKRQRIVIELEMPQAGPQYEFKPTPATGWWGASIFASAGCMAGVDKEAAEAARRRMTFDEDDQARIYNTAQAKKSQGKVGLGQGTGTVKVGGVKWSGNRVSFEDPEGGGEADEAAAAAAGGGDEARARLAALGSSTHLVSLGSDEGAAAGDAGGRRKEKKKGKKSKGAAQRAEQQQAEQGAAAAPSEQQQPAEQPSAAAGEPWEAAVKWRKVISAQLAAAERQQLTLKELQRQVVAAVLQKHAALVSSKAAVKAAFSARLASSSKWVVEGKVVRLRGE